VAKKRPTLSERMAAELGKTRPLPPEILPDEQVFVQKHKRHVEGFPANVHVIDWRERKPGDIHPAILQTEREHPAPDIKYPGYTVDLPSGQKAFWNEFTPKAAIEKGLLTDEKLNHWADQWMQPGGNRYAELLYADRLWNVYGMWENYNLKPATKGYIPWSDRSHYFDWNAWKANYTKLKG
jgi:hypothetical protein